METHYDDKHGLAYELSYLADGGVQLSAQSPELEFRKTSYADGHLDLRLVSHDDTVVFAVNASGIQLTRGARTVTLGAGATETDFDKARALIAGSRAVKRYRQLGAALEAANDDSATAHSTLMGAAIVGLIDGDPGAPTRIAKRLGGKKTAGLRKAGMAVDCYASYENFTYNAWVDYESCMDLADWWNYSLVSHACTFRWVIRVEGYWFQYISCSSFPLK